MVGTVNASPDDFRTGVDDLIKAEAPYPGWLAQLLTTPVHGLENYRQMIGSSPRTERRSRSTSRSRPTERRDAPCADALGRAVRRRGRAARRRSRPGAAAARGVQRVPLVPRRTAQHLPQRGRPPRRIGPRVAACRNLRQPGHRHEARLHVCGRARRGRPPRRGAAELWRRARRPGRPLHADGSGGRVRHARVRPARSRALRRLRRVRPARACAANRRRRAEGGPLGVLRDRGRSRHRVQTAPGQGPRARLAPASALRDPAATRASPSARRIPARSGA
jgi:hypothetical protein